MKTKIESKEVLYEINGRLFSDREEAVIEARLAIDRAAGAFFADHALTPGAIRFERFAAEVPPGAIVVEGHISGRGADSEFKAMEVQQVVRPVGSGSRYPAKLWVKRWTPVEVRKWSDFWDNSLLYRFRGCTPEEFRLGYVANTVSIFGVNSATTQMLPSELAFRWRQATTEMYRDLLAETLLCAYEVGLSLTMHEVFAACPEIALRSEHLARSRDSDEHH